MPVAKPRRLTIPTAQSLHDRLQREALSCAYSRRELDEVESAHPNLIAEDGPNILTAISHGDAIVLPYSFESARAFADRFARMFEKVLPRARKAYAADTVRFRLEYGPARPQVEPVLRRLSFSPRKAWFRFSLEKGTASLKTAAPRGVIFREGGVADIDELLAIDREAFPDTPMTRAGFVDQLEAGGRALIAQQKGSPVGFVLYSQDDPDTGYLRTLAVREAVRGLGIGAALALRTAKAVFSEGAVRLDLRTDDDNGGAIRLYKRLGFKAVGSGRDYERPADPRVIEAMRKQSEGTFIKFGGWR
jgi:ribosomal protein S18 acetylase RimI-like enzyme